MSCSSSASKSAKLRSPSTWCEDEVRLPRPGTFLRNHADGIAAIDMFVAASASSRLLYVTIILTHERRRIIHTAVTEHPTAAWLSRQVTEAFPWDTAPRYPLRDRDRSSGAYFSKPTRSDGDHGGHHGATLTLAERLRRARDRFDSPRVIVPITST